MTSNRIAFLMSSAATGKLTGELKRREDILKQIASKDTEINMFGLQTEAKKSSLGAIQSAYESVLSVPKTLKTAKAAEEAGYQALIISCGGDPGVSPLRETINVPIVPPGMSAKHICSMLGRRFSILTTGKAGYPRVPDIHEKGGLLKLASVHRVGLSVPEVRVKKEEAIEAMIREGKKAVKEYGANSLTFGCMSMGFLMVDEYLTEEIGVPVVNPVKAAVKMAELYIDLGLTHSRLVYPTPPSLRKGN
jgi:allantoin racemase